MKGEKFRSGAGSALAILGRWPSRVRVISGDPHLSTQAPAEGYDVILVMASLWSCSQRHDSHRLAIEELRQLGGRLGRELGQLLL